MMTELANTLGATADGDSIAVASISCSGLYSGGSSANVSGSGFPLTASATKAFGVYADDNGTLLGASAVRAGQFRTLITLSHSNETSIFGVQNQLKIKAPLDCTLTTGNRAGSWNYLEIAGTLTKTVTLSGSQKATAACFGMVEWDGVGALTLSSGHTLGAFVALTNVVSGGGTFTQTGKFAAFAAVNNATASYSKFRYGLYLPMEAVVEGIRVGELSSAADGSGLALSATYTAAVRVHADTGSAALASSSTRAFLARYLIGTTPAVADTSTYGAESLLKIIASYNTSGNSGGILGHLESAGTVTITGSINTVRAGVASFLDLAANATVAANTIVSAFGVNPANFGTTMTGRSAVIHVTNPMSGTWGSFLDLSSATGCTQDTAAGSTGGKFLKIYINGVLYTAALLTA